MSFEYKTITEVNQEKLVDSYLNPSGEQGWELVSVCYNEKGGCYVAFMKRPLQGTKKGRY